MMKPDHNNHVGHDNFDDFLSAQLQRTQPYLPDDDFTARVMGNLPAAKKLPVWKERLIIFIPLVIITALVLSQFSILAIVIKVWTAVAGLNVANVLQIGLFTTAAVVSGASFWFAKQFKLL